MPELKMQFDPSTLEHLGIQMYSRLPNALAELIANAYDADASIVEIKLYDSDENNKKIEIIDDGMGMSFEEVNDKFLRIGRHRRTFDGNRKTPKGRIITGRKGLGKLALFGIGKNIQITTKNGGSTDELTFDLNWNDITNCDDSEYKPNFTIQQDKEAVESYTRIVLSELERKSAFDLDLISNSLSRLFNLMDDNFRIFLSLNDDNCIEITKELKYSNIETEFKWKINETVNEIGINFESKNNLKGTIIATPKPVPSSLRGITLYVNGRMANEAGFFGSADSSHVYSYLTGWIEADYIDEYSDDLISTDRQSLNWELEPAEKLQNYLKEMLKFIEKSWRTQRAEKNKKDTIEKTKIDIDRWTTTMSETLGRKVKNVVDNVMEEESIGSDVASKIVSTVYEMAPEYADYHFRELHDAVQDASQEDYKNQDYYDAFLEAAKRYVNSVALKSGSPKDGISLMTEVFGSSLVLDVAKKYINNPQGIMLREFVLDDIRRGQMHLSMGIVSGGRNPLSHQEHGDLKTTGIFTEKDCLDLLSLLSHLFKRLDDA